MNTSDPSSKNFPQAQAVVRFWLDAGPGKWFAKDQALDDAFRSKFLDLHFAAARRELEDWAKNPEACLALLILLDQFPRNAFRGTAHMFATDALARHYAGIMIDQGHAAHIAPELRLFVCTPFVHSELLADQDYALTLYGELAPDGLKWANIHHDIIARFGRFPHRNDCLARVTTEEEQRFLDEGGFSG
ncbi:DUF924 family protein [Allopusillimonas ginsengisoli]|nr:DUF924 family protein [Allopusillimonas ginsengisoli]